MTSPAYPPLALSERLWRPPGVIAAPTAAALVSTGTVTPTSGQVYYIGGPGCVIPAGKTARSISFLSGAAAVSPTNTWFFLAMPDDEFAMAYILASTEQAGTAAWPANTVKTLSLETADGGSGAFTAAVDTPVYIGIVQVATTPATLRGLSASAFVGIFMGSRQYFAGGPSGRTTPFDMNQGLGMGAVGLFPCACFVGGD